MGESFPSAEKQDETPVILFKKGPSRTKANFRKRQHVTNASDQSSEEDTLEQNTRPKRKFLSRSVATSLSTEEQLKKDIFIPTAQADRQTPLADSNDATKQSNMPGSDNKKLGPKRSTNVRTTTVFDFAPDVCKDYKTTGFCGYGDGCKFAHDRSNVKQGWQLDREWETITKGRKNLGGTVVATADNSASKGEVNDDADDASSEDMPPTCFLCEDVYKSPVITRCGHTFCEACALSRYRRDPTCAVCGVGTNGVFNSANRLGKRLVK